MQPNTWQSRVIGWTFLSYYYLYTIRCTLATGNPAVNITFVPCTACGITGASRCEVSLRVGYGVRPEGKHVGLYNLSGGGMWLRSLAWKGTKFNATLSIPFFCLSNRQPRGTINIGFRRALVCAYCLPYTSWEPTYVMLSHTSSLVLRILHYALHCIK